MPHLTLTSLPIELLQEIAWLSCNPNVYWTSKSVRSRLCPLQDFTHDLTFLLFCDRKSPYSAWHSRILPWRTHHARLWDLELTEHERYELQRFVFNLECLTIPRLLSMIRLTIESWIKLYAPLVQFLPSVHKKRLQAYLATTNDYFHNYWVEDEKGNRLTLLNGSRLAVTSADAHDHMSMKYVVDVQYVPTRLLEAEKDDGDDLLSRTLLSRTRMDSLNHLILKKHIATAKPKWME